MVERLLALVVPAAQAGAAVAPDGVDLVHEDDAGRVLLGLLEQVADAGGAHAHEHLDEVGRIYDYSEELGVSTYNLISTIGSFVLGIGVVMVVANLLWSAKHGRKAGNDPWKANTLEWFTQSPPPPNNFDVIPRVRSLEPMKDIRREVLAEITPVETVAQPLAPRSV